jgi:hypothetical protein
LISGATFCCHTITFLVVLFNHKICSGCNIYQTRPSKSLLSR